MNNTIANDLMDLLNASPVNFLAVDYIKNQLDKVGAIEIDPAKALPTLSSDNIYYTIKNGSAIFAFRPGTGNIADNGFRLITAHSDSPCFRIKPNAEMMSEGGLIRLNTEVYGGAILYTWFDRPLSLAGRVMLRTDNPLRPEQRLLHIKRPLLVIPHLAIHFNRQVNEGHAIGRQKEMMPVLGYINDQLEKKGLLVSIIAKELDVCAEDILDFDIYLYDTTPACLVGLNEEFINSGRIDDLGMAHAAMRAMLDSKPATATQVIAIFDNEETGSGTKQGAHSPVLKSLLERVVTAKGGTKEDFLRAIEQSFLISADNAHGLHPNYAELQDPTNHPLLGGGPVIKYNANQKYATDADSAAVFMEICRKAGVPCQQFVNHSDVAGGSTLGNILTAQLPLRGVDMGNALWAMHSVRETASVIDQEYTVKAFTTFFNL